jgi:hypothetical protein
MGLDGGFYRSLLKCLIKEYSMEKELKGVHKHMLSLGLGALTHANWHANYFSEDNKHWSELSVIQAAHAAEILIKARIAEEHPLLIFENVPKPADSTNLLGLEQLIESGRTFQYSDLPHRLWATTGIKLPNLELYQTFGRLRNAIQHFTFPDRDVSQDAIEFIFGVIDPFINDCWGLYAVDFNEDHEPYIYLVNNIVRRGVKFIVSPGVVDSLEDTELEWPKKNQEYKSEMIERFKAAGSKLDFE